MTPKVIPFYMYTHICKLHLSQDFPVLSWLSLINIYSLQQFLQQMRNTLVYWSDWENTVVRQSLSFTTFALLIPLIPELFSVEGMHYQMEKTKYRLYINHKYLKYANEP